MHGIGNDFVIVDSETVRGIHSARLAIDLCDRHFGVGADGLLIVGASDRAACRMRMFNPDGTEDDCGNGLRCVVRHAHEALSLPAEFTVETLSGIHCAQVLVHGRQESLVRVSMAAPRVHPSEIPMLISGDSAIGVPIPLGSRKLIFTCVNTGSTHSVTFLDGPVDSALFAAESPALEHHPLFPARTSVLWAWPDGTNRFRVRIWERGVGETLGCGTGACAVAVAAQLEYRSSERTTVASQGGELTIEWTPGDAIWMTGPATSVFRGDWEV